MAFERDAPKAARPLTLRWASKNEREIAHSKVAFGRYVQDSACDTWELLADAVHPGGSAAIKKCGWPLPGQVKHEWAEKIGPLIDPERNISPVLEN